MNTRLTSRGNRAVNEDGFEIAQAVVCLSRLPDGYGAILGSGSVTSGTLLAPAPDKLASQP